MSGLSAHYDQSDGFDAVDEVLDAGTLMPDADDFAYDVAIVGLGYVGLPTALAFHAAGSRVLGLDVSAARLAAIHQQDVDLVEDDRRRLAVAVDDNRFWMSTDPALLSQAAAVIVCVPTPVDEYLVPDLTIIRQACDMVNNAAVAGQVLILTSTTYAGSSLEMLVTPLTSRGFTVGNDIFVAFSPERIDPGNDRFAHEDVARVLGGATEQCAKRAEAVLRGYARNLYIVQSTEAAEMTKLLENTFRAVNIALANEFADICNTLGLDIIEIIDAAATKPYGFMPFYPGPGAGGHCIPCDPRYLLWQLRKERVGAPVIEQAMHALAIRPNGVVVRVRQVLSERGMGLRGARVLVVGVSYKRDVADLRESPALEIISSLSAAGAEVGYFDPLFPSLDLDGIGRLEGCDEPAAFDADLVFVHTAHTNLSREWLSTEKLVLDGTYRLASLPNRVLL